MENNTEKGKIISKTITISKPSVKVQLGQGVLYGLFVALLSGYLYAGLLAGFSSPLQGSRQGGDGQLPLVNWTYDYVRPVDQSPLWEQSPTDENYYTAFQYSDNIAMSSDYAGVYNSCHSSNGIEFTYYRWDRTGHPYPECNFNANEMPPVNMADVYSIDLIVIDSFCYECNDGLQLGTTIRLDRTNGWAAGWQNGGRGFDLSAAWSSSNTLLHYYSMIYEYAGGGPFTVIFEVRYRMLTGTWQCGDGTYYWQCSTNQPYWCDPEQGLIPRCDLCGCPGGAPICCPYGGCQSVECGGSSPAVLKGSSPAIMKPPQWFMDQWSDWCDDHPNDPLC